MCNNNSTTIAGVALNMAELAAVATYANTSRVTLEAAAKAVYPAKFGRPVGRGQRVIYAPNGLGSYGRQLVIVANRQTTTNGTLRVWLSLSASEPVAVQVAKLFHKDDNAPVTGLTGISS